MNLYNYTATFLLILIFSCCTTKNDKRFSNSKDAKKIEAGFNSYLTHDKLEELSKYNSFEELYNAVSVFSGIIDSIRQEISPKIFNDIWVYDGESYDINRNGDYYTHFLKNVGERNELIKSYYESIEAAGGMNPLLCQ